jgi:hypothetical protein
VTPIEPEPTPEEPIDPVGYELIDDPADDWNAPKQVYSRRMKLWVRIVLVLVALLFLGVFSLAAWLNPYDAEGNRRTMATHTQIGLPPCSMVQLIGKPCPSCGMTTSFSLLVHGDLIGSAQANWVGTLLALYWMSVIPWALISAYRRKYVIVRSGETVITVGIILFLVLSLGRWAYVLLVT